MSVRYVPVKWNRNKQIYDLCILAVILAFLTGFIAVASLGNPDPESISFPILLMRAFGACAFFLLHLVLIIGPLARLDRRLLPLVYNRRHLGIATFLVAFMHGVAAVGYYHGFGNTDPIRSLLSGNTRFDSLRSFPFEIPGLLALGILFLLASTSHDFWQKCLGGTCWKWLHMLVYPAYALLMVHVAFGALQSDPDPLAFGLLMAGFLLVTGLHLATARRESRQDSASPIRIPLSVVWVEVARVQEIPDLRAKIVSIPGQERIALFRYGNRISAVTNVCAHQRGPLGEGKIVDGCITCPWHGWEYRPDTGCSPPPFQEKIATYPVRVEGDRVFVHPVPNPPGTPVIPAVIEESCHA